MWIFLPPLTSARQRIRYPYIRSGADWRGKGFWSAVPDQIQDQWATAQDVWKFLKRHTVDLEPSKESPAIFNYAVGSSIDLVKAMKTVRERPIVAAIRVGRDFARLKNEIYGGPIYGINHAEFRHLRKEYVVLIGFGWDRTIDRYYWLVLGCYGSDWGDGGVGKVYMDVMMRKRENDPNSWEYLIYDISWPSLTRKENWMKCKDC